MISRNLLAAFGYLVLASSYGVNGLYFTCFMQLTEANCTQQSLAPYCMWSSDSQSCDLSPLALNLICKYNGPMSMCDQARNACPRLLSQSSCDLQDGVCRWNSTECVAILLSGDDRESENNSSAKTQTVAAPTPSLSPTISPSESPSEACCEDLRGICKHRMRLRRRAGLIKAARASCSRPHNSMHDLCGLWKRSCS